MNHVQCLVPPRRLQAAVLVLAGCGSSGSTTAPSVPTGTTAELAILETTDLHTNLLSYDYFKLTEDRLTGLRAHRHADQAGRVPSLPNTLLIDNGDTIQGTALADYQALRQAGQPAAEKLATYKAMDAIGYDAGTLGNHEFNYGLPYLAR